MEKMATERRKVLMSTRGRLEEDERDSAKWRKGKHRKRIAKHFVTAIASTKGANRNFLFWDVFKEFPVSQLVAPRLPKFRLASNQIQNVV
jgi:hypothetical protein